ncbi:MAG: hypothetical protein VCD66_08520 [Alphaproteobacteria bacterium]
MEISQLTKKKPDGAVNAFKLKLINKVITSGNFVLGENYRPFSEFSEFDVDDVPTNSDVTLILSQYMRQAERSGLFSSRDDKLRAIAPRV